MYTGTGYYLSLNLRYVYGFVGQVHHCSVAVVVGKPIDTAKLTYNDREALCDQVQKGVKK